MDLAEMGQGDLLTSSDKLLWCWEGVGRRGQNVGMRLRRAGEAQEAYREIHLLDSLWLCHYDCCDGVRWVWVGCGSSADRRCPCVLKGDARATAVVWEEVAVSG